MNTLLNRFFDLRGHGTSARTEVIAGIVTFLTMAYIIAVNPAILSDAGLPRQATVAATCLAAAVPTILMGLWAKWPLALAPGMGLNAFLTYSLVKGQNVGWPTAMGVVFVEGAIVMLLVLLGAREAIMRAIPDGLKTAIGVGIGLFIAFIGLQHAGWVVASRATLVEAGRLTQPPTLVATAGLLVTALLIAWRVRGALLLGVAATTLLAAFATQAFGARS
jgi:AGZA family xanthine/uracil permease-like MFS transporter